MQLPQTFKKYMLQFAELYYRYKVESGQMRGIRYRIHSTLADYQKEGTIQLSITDKPGDLLPPITLEKIKKMPDILSGLHPMDVNSINDLYYLSSDPVKEIRVQGEIVQAINHDGSMIAYNINDAFEHEQLVSKRVAFMIGYMQAEKMMHEAYAHQERYTVTQDNITTLQILDAKTNKHVLMNPLDILFSETYKCFSKEDIARIGYICGQMSQV